MKLFILLLFCYLHTQAQPANYTTANAHSHNDYHQAVPFWTAYEHGFGSIEADIFLQDNELLVAHDTQELRQHHTLQEYYIQPLLSCLQKNGGFAYPDSTKKLQLLIDIKTDSIGTLNKLIQLISVYPALTNTPTIKWVISGNRPSPDLFSSYPPFIWFDAELRKQYSAAAWSRIAMLSDNFARYSRWRGEGRLPEKALLLSVIKEARQHHKPARLWNAPDNREAWQQLIQLGVDYINTDHIAELDAFLQQRSPKKKARRNTVAP
ncbi:MAG: alkaline phosphatase [Williamsia sp.]|nr:alkaline phosphatase [Williamsia sp.]